MIDEVPPVVPHAVTEGQAAQAAPGESRPLPTAEQARAADQVFTDPSRPDPVATFLGVTAGIVLLHDVVADTLDTADDDEDEPGPEPAPRPEPAS